MTATGGDFIGHISLDAVFPVVDNKLGLSTTVDISEFACSGVVASVGSWS